MIFMGMEISSLNGKRYFKVGENNLFILEYVTPKFNDYKEWRVCFELKNNVNTNLLMKEKFFNFNFDSIDDTTLIYDIETIFDNINANGEINFDDEENSFSSDNILTYIEYRKPTDEEMEEYNNHNIEEYKIGNFVYVEGEDENLIPVEDFKPTNELFNVCFIFLKTVLENKQIINSSETLLIL